MTPTRGPGGRWREYGARVWDRAAPAPAAWPSRLYGNPPGLNTAKGARPGVQTWQRKGEIFWEQVVGPKILRPPEGFPGPRWKENGLGSHKKHTRPTAIADELKKIVTKEKSSCKNAGDKCALRARLQFSEGWWRAGGRVQCPGAHPTCSVSVAQEAGGTAGVTLIQVTRFLELSPQPEQLARAERNTLRDDRPPIHATVTVPEGDPGP